MRLGNGNAATAAVVFPLRVLLQNCSKSCTMQYLHPFCSKILEHLVGPSCCCFCSKICGKFAVKQTREMQLQFSISQPISQNQTSIWKSVGLPIKQHKFKEWEQERRKKKVKKIHRTILKQSRTQNYYQNVSIPV